MNRLHAATQVLAGLRFQTQVHDAIDQSHRDVPVFITRDVDGEPGMGDYSAPVDS